MRRSHLLQLLEAALAAQQPAYALQLIQRYLADWPGDLAMQFMLARAHIAAKAPAAAIDVLQNLIAADPEDFPAQRLLADLLSAQASSREAQLAAYAAAHIGDGLGAPAPLKLPEWTSAARAAYLAEKIGDWDTARTESRAALTQAEQPLPSLVHLCALWHAGQLDLAQPLAEGFHARWPNVVAFKLCLAECLFATGGHARAIQLLHDAAAQDVIGRVAARHWGEAHPYRALWQAEPGVTLPGPLPAELIRALGLNRLPGSQRARAEVPKKKSDLNSEDVADIQAALDSLAAQLTGKASTSSTGRETLILLSSRTRLTGVFGADGFIAVDDAMQALAKAQRQMRAVCVYVDEAQALKPFGLQPVNPSNAWEIKLLLAQIVEHLRAAGDMLGALLIVGGPEIIPFHHLPNPTEDPDPDIPSDNPYATSDENYFVPEWPVGRLPSGTGGNPMPLVRSLRKAARQHAQSQRATPSQTRWLIDFLRQLLRLVWPVRTNGTRASFGYSANVWKDAAGAVYEVIGSRRELLTSPPVDATRLPAKGLAPARLSYFNLHGVEDGPEWYGQRRPDDPLTVPEYPVALRPADITNSGRAPVIVFSEACYGANVFGKGVDDSLALRFLDCGTRAVIASTKIAYGSVDEPLIGADLLGRCFWQNVNAGLPVGEALRLAKLQMAQEMHNRQGFLDGEDQKTLISFVLYGDPLAMLETPAPGAAKEAKRRALAFTRNVLRPTVAATTPLETSLTPESLAQIKTLVAQYLPDMQDAELRAARSRTAPANGNAKRRGERATIITLAKTVRTRSRSHPHYARVTLNDKGELLKLSVSR